MSRDLAAWRADLARAAPSADPTMIRVLARLLGTEADVDALLIAADALEDTVAELLLDDRRRPAAELIALAELIRMEVAGRSNPRGNFW